MAGPTAGFRPDPDDPTQLRWWDGSEWGEQRATPVVVHDFEDLRGDIRSIRNMLQFFVVLTVLSIVLTIAGVVG